MKSYNLNMIINIEKIKQSIQTLKQQKWTHIVTPFFLTYFLAFIVSIICYVIIDDFSYPYFVILCGACLYPFLFLITIIVIIFLKILSFRFKKIDKINNNFLLHNFFYSILWFLGILTLIVGSVVFMYNILKP